MWPLQIPVLRLCIILYFMNHCKGLLPEEDITANFLFYLQLIRLLYVIFFFFLNIKMIYLLFCDFMWWEERVSYRTCTVGCKHYSWRWNVNVIPLILLNVRGVYVFMGCFCTHHWRDVWSGGSDNRPARVNEQVEHFKWRIFIVLLTSIITSQTIFCHNCKYESFFFKDD